MYIMLLLHCFLLFYLHQLNLSFPNFIISLDGLYTSLYFFNSNNITSTMIDRYSVYFLLNICYYFCIYFFIYDLYIIYYLIFSFVTIPFMFDYCKNIGYVNRYLISVNNSVNNVLSSFCKDFFYILFYNVCNGHNIFINKKYFSYEINLLLDNGIDYYTYIMKTIILYIMIYVNKNSMYYNIFKYVYYYKFNKSFIIMNRSESKKYILDNLIDRNFIALFDDNGIQAILQLYLTKNDTYEFIKKVHYKIMFVISMWSILEIFQYNKILNYIVMLIFNVYMYYKDNYKNLIFVNTFFCISKNPLLVSFSSQFCYDMICNTFMYNNVKKIYKKCEIILYWAHKDLNIYLKNIVLLLFVKMLKEYNIRYIYFVFNFSNIFYIINSIGFYINSNYKLFLFVYCMSIIENIIQHNNDINFNIKNNVNSLYILENDELYTKMDENVVINDSYFNPLKKCEHDEYIFI